MLRRLVGHVLLAAALVSPLEAGEPTERLRALFDEANRILLAADADTELDSRVEAIRALLRNAFDAREAAALALGREWHARSAAERDEFVRLHADLIERAYLAWIGSRARVHGDGVRVAFESESVQGDTASVVTTLRTRGGGEMPVEYRMGRRAGRWAVHDVVIDGLSLADSYRAQFQRVMQGGGYAALVDRLHDKASPETLLEIAKAKGTRLAAAAAVAPLRPASASDAPAIGPAPAATTPLVVSSAPVSRTRPAAVATPAITPPAPVSAPAPPPLEVVAAPVFPRPEPAPLALAPAPVPQPSVTPPVPRKWFWIQVGAFRNTEAASRLVERLWKHSVTVATGGARAPAIARVLVGPFTTRSAAASTLRELSAAGHRAFIAFE